MCGVLVGLPGAAARAAEGRPGFQITPFGGYGIRGAMALDDPDFSELDMENNPVYGLAIGMEVHEGLLEIMWTHQDSEIRAVPVRGGPPAEQFNVNTDQVHFNGLYFPPQVDGATLHPYVMAGLGFTNFAPTGDFHSESRFSWALGGGAQFEFTTRLGLRLEGKWNPALTSSSGGVFCNSSTGRCYFAASGELINQFDFTAGLTLKI
jgi:opacity protein-like surface antigen